MMNIVSRGEKIHKSDIRRILVRATNWVGDAVMSLPALEAVRENFPGSRISVLAKPWVTPIFESHPAVDQIIPFKKRQGYLRGSLDMFRLCSRIRNGGFDLTVLFQNAFEAALVARLGGSRYIVGYDADARGFLLTHPVKRNEAVLRVHQVEYYLCILRAMGWEAPNRDPVLYVSERHIDEAKHLLRSHGLEAEDFLVGIGPGAIYGKTKRWPPERFARIGDQAVEKWGAKVLVMGSRAESRICERLCKTMTHGSVNICGLTSLGVAIALVSLFGIFITNDSGLMHISAALGVPTVAIFGSTDPVATGPRGPNTRIVKHDVDCAPCLKPVCPKDYRCLLEIEPEEVWEAMEDLKRSSV